jgi:hypothetical protein
MPSKLVLAMLFIIACLFTLADFFTEGIRSKILDFLSLLIPIKLPSRNQSTG